MKRTFAVLAVVAMVAAACGGNDDEAATTATTAGTGGEHTSLTVEVDGKNEDIGLATFAYFPNEVTAHAGDTVSFRSNDTGEPHTVTFGTLVDAGVKAFRSLPDEVKNADGPPDASKLPPEQAKAVAAVEATEKALPSLLPDGPGDANQMAANPCFAEAAPTATDKACPKVEQPAFDGRQAVYNSGYLPGDATFDVELAEDLAPGTYAYFCLLHRYEMSGTVTVVPEDQKAQTADEVHAAGEKALDDMVAKLRPQAEAMAKTPADKPVAGGPQADGPPVAPAMLAAFAPKELTVPAGGTVTWSVFGPHTVAVNAPQDTVGLFVKAPDGTFHINEKAVKPEGSPGPPPPTEGEPKPDAKPVVVEGGRFDGAGYRSSGLILSFGPPGYQYKLTFAKAGTYQVQCQIHPDMKATVKVS